MEQSTKALIVHRALTVLAGAAIAFGWAAGVIPVWLAGVLLVAALVLSVVIKDALRGRGAGSVRPPAG